MAKEKDVAAKEQRRQKKKSRVPITEPPFKLSDLKKAIPEHCFERSLIRSTSYLVADLIVVSILFYAISFIPLLPPYAAPFAWVAYWLLQGYFFTGLWVVAHECGHQAYSAYPLVNDCVGLVVHSLLLVPYFSWKISHAKHHSKTGNIELDEAFVPAVKDNSTPEPRINAIKAAFLLTITLSIGWFLYLGFHLTGRKYPKWVSHFNPWSPLFSPREVPLVLISDVGILATVSLLAYLSYQYSFLWVVMVYGIPYLHCNFWLVAITLLQHTDLRLPHYYSKEWRWLKGALCTVDRDYGFLNHIFHHIGDTHVAHHLFSTMPHYHAVEATKALKPILQEYYLSDDSSVLLGIWKSFYYCDDLREESTGGQRTLWFYS